jgi:uncharacterized protein
MKLTALYASVHALIFVGLSVRAILLRTKFKVTLGDGGQVVLQRAQRVQGNFAEYVPFSLLLTLLVESSGAPGLVVHGLGLCLLVGRVIHAYGLSQVREHLALRTVGMVLTFITIASAALLLILKYGFAFSLV